MNSILTTLFSFDIVFPKSLENLFFSVTERYEMKGILRVFADALRRTLRWR